MRRAVAMLVLVTATLAAGAGQSSAAGTACPTTNGPNELVLAGGSAQMAQLGKQFQTPLQVELANTNGCALTGNLAGVTVEFDAPGSGPSGIFASSGGNVAVVGTDAQGVATAPALTANYTAGAYSVDAHSDYGTVDIDVSNTANGVPSAIAALTGSGQQATVGAEYAQALQARVTDANGNPVQGAVVGFSVVPGPTGATAGFLGGAAATAVTDSNGVATAPPLLAGATPGKFTATASTDGLSSIAVFSLDDHAETMTLAATADAALRATVEARYGAPLHVRVLDDTGAPVEGASVTFSIATAASGAGASFVGGSAQATALADADGVATSPGILANKVAGAFTVTAAAVGAPTASFALTNLAARAAAVSVGAAGGSSTTVDARFPIPLAVTVTDKDGNAVAGAKVVFAAPKKGATGRFTHKRRRVTVTTGVKGIAVAPRFTANGTAGGFVVTVRVVGSSARAAFALVNAPR
jgi:protocatechuate 3,4-dioxygenase beta subunit